MCKLVDLCDRTTKAQMESGPDKTKMIINNSGQSERYIRMNGTWIETMKNLKYLSSSFSDEGCLKLLRPQQH